MKALFYRVTYAVAEFCRRAPVPRETYIQTETGEPILTEGTGEPLLTE